jgi:hypothetical protein
MGIIMTLMWQCNEMQWTFSTQYDVMEYLWNHCGLIDVLHWLWNKNELIMNRKLELLKTVGGLKNELSMEYVGITE